MDETNMDRPSIRKEPYMMDTIIHNVLNWGPLIGCLIGGVVGLMGAVSGLDAASQQPLWAVGGGLYLIGSAIAFGVIVNAVLRK